MTSRRKLLARSFLAFLALLVLAAATLYVVGWPAATHATHPSTRGRTTTLAELERVMDAPGPLEVETIVGADWEVDRSGVIDLGDPRAAGLEDGPEPIQVYAHALRHPTAGLFLIDTGVERAVFRDPEHAAVRGLVASAGHLDRMREGTAMGDWLEAHASTPVTAVLLTHLHLDHVAGLADVPASVPVVLGEGETTSRQWMNALTEPSIDRALGDHPVETWAFDPATRGEGVIDVLGDGSLFAMEVPGHTHGSVAFVARTPEGPILFTGDVSHTAWGWEHDVAPGTFTEDAAANRESLARLRALAARHPGLRVRLGHQPME